MRNNLVSHLSATFVVTDTRNRFFVEFRENLRMRLLIDVGKILGESTTFSPSSEETTMPFL